MSFKPANMSHTGQCFVPGAALASCSNPGRRRAGSGFTLHGRSIVGLLLVICTFAHAQSATRALVEQALDEPFRVVLDNIRLGDAIEQISQQSGVPIHIRPDVLNLAPYGAETVVQRIEIRDMTLRSGLVELLSPLGMKFDVSGDHVEVQLIDALRCLGRAPSWEELDTFAELSGLEPGLRGEHLEKLRTMIRFEVSDPNGWTTLSSAIRRVGAGSGADVLTRACATLNWGWCVEGPLVVVRSAAAEVSRQLQQPISLRMTFRPLIEILQALGQKAGIAVNAEPGALQSLPLQVRKNFSILAKDVPVEMVLERIACETGLGYLIEPEGILFYKVREPSDQQAGLPVATNDANGPNTGGSGPDPYVAKIVVALPDGKTVEWLIRRSELPPDLQSMRENALQEAFAAIRAQSDAK